MVKYDNHILDICSEAQCDRKHAMPAYQFVAGVIRSKLASGTDVIGFNLPKEHDIAESFGVSLITVRRALHILETEGLITKSRGKLARVVRSQPVKDTLERKLHVLADLRLEPGRITEVISYKRTLVDATILQQGGGTIEAWELIIRHLWGDVIIGYAFVYIRLDLGEKLKQEDFGREFVYQTVERLAYSSTKTAYVRAKACIATNRDVHYSGAQPGEAIMEVVYRHFDERDHISQVTINRFIGTLYELSYEL